MAKGYLVSAYRSIKDPDKLAAYAKIAAPAFAKYGAKYLARGGELIPRESDLWSPTRMVLIRFPDLKTAQDCLDSPEYQAIVGISRRSAKRTVVILDGL